MIDAPTPSDGNGSGPANNTESTGRFSPGHSGNPAGRPKGVPNKATLAHKEFCRSILEDERYRENLRTRAWQGALTPAEITLLHYYGYGKPKDTVQLESEVRAPTQIVILGDFSDPLARPQEPKRRLPAPPTTNLPEVGFTLEDFDEGNLSPTP